MAKTVKATIPHGVGVEKRLVDYINAQLKTSGGGGGFSISSTTPTNTSTTWVDTGNVYAGMYPLRKYINGVWEPITPSMDYFDPIGSVISKGKPLLVGVAGQSNTATSFNRDYLGSKATGYYTTSTTSINTATVIIGSILSITVDVGLLWLPGDTLNLTSNGTPQEFINGIVTSYNSGTGLLSFSVITTPTSALSYTDWNISRLFTGDIAKDNKITLWNADTNAWVIPDFINQPSGATSNNWSWNLNVYGSNNIQTFAKEFVKKYSRSVRIVQWRQGGTPLAYWELGATGGYPGWVGLNSSLLAANIPDLDVFIFVHGEGGLSDSTYISNYTTYKDGLYFGIINNVRSASWGKKETAFLMPSIANGMEQVVVDNSQFPAEYAIRTLNDGNNQYNGWAQSKGEKQIRVPTAGEGGNTSSTSINLSTQPINSNFTITVSGSFAYSINNPIWIVSRADERNRAKLTYVSGVGTLTVFATIIYGSGTHTDWDVLPQDYLHLTVLDNVANGMSLAQTFERIGSQSKKVTINQTIDPFGNLLVSSESHPPSDDTQEWFSTRQLNSGKALTQGFISAGVVAGTKIFAQATGGSSEVDYIFMAKSGGEATINDEVFRINNLGSVVKKPIYFGAPVNNNIVDARIEKYPIGADGPGLKFVSGWTGNQLAVYVFQLGNVGNILELHENTGGGSQYALLAANLKLGTVGNGIYIKEGSNATMGTATANGTTGVVVSTTKVTANSRIFLTCQTPGGTPGVLFVSSRVAGTSFTFKSSAGDTSTIAWLIIEPA